jgi:predicted metal-dependent phosphotriesterase family hydrolase
MKEMVNSATGPVALDDLGIILPHEHLLFARDERLPFLKQELIDYIKSLENIEYKLN